MPVFCRPLTLILTTAPPALGEADAVPAAGGPAAVQLAEVAARGLAQALVLFAGDRVLDHPADQLIIDRQRGDAHPIVGGVACSVVDVGAQHPVDGGGLEIVVGDHAFVVDLGAAVTLADIVLVPQVTNARRYPQIDLKQFPNILRIDAALRQIEAFSKAAPENQPEAKEAP